MKFVSDSVETAFTSLSTKIKLPATVAGATLLAIGGSAGEFFTSMNSAIFFGIFEIGLVTIVWSAIFNLFVITGAIGIRAKKPIPIAKKGVIRDMIFYAIAAILLVIFVWDGKMTRVEGFGFLGFYAVYLYILFWRSKHAAHEHVEHFHLPNWKIIFFAVGGLAAIAALSWGMIETGLELAAIFGISIAVVSALIFAFGTSISDTFIAVSAAKKGNGSGAVSSIFGSNTFDIAVCLGTPIVIVGTVPVNIEVVRSSLVMLFLSIIIVGFFVINDWKISKREAWLSLITFGIFLTAFLCGI
ncbi:sodium:calcium antiporter [bacterium]|nr:sodium:calcium antiporter [bacterium]MBT7772348.1 sodium:calcium antiporter [bacterium]